MSHLLTSGQVGEIGLSQMRRIRENTISKWDSLGFLEGLNGHIKENIADLYQCCKVPTKTRNGIKYKIKKHKI